MSHNTPASGANSAEIRPTAVRLAMARLTRWPDYSLRFRERWIQFFVNGRSEAEMRERAPLEYLPHMEELRASGKEF